MELRKHSTLKVNNGFTSLELMLVVTIILVLAGFSGIAPLGLYRAHVLNAERDNLISILQYIRSRALSNVDRSPHGIKVESSQYTLFQGNAFDSRDQSKDIRIPLTQNILRSATGEIIFLPFRGNISTDQIVKLSPTWDRDLVITVTVNNEGVIIW